MNSNHTQDKQSSKMSFRVDAFKREYKNKPIEQVKTWLSEHFDADKASIYLATYKEDDIPEVGFVRKNKFNGYYQQLDNKMHSKAFAMGVYADGQMHYVWILSTPEVPVMLKDSALYEVCTWEKVTPEDTRIWTLIYPDTEAESYLFM